MQRRAQGSDGSVGSGLGGELSGGLSFLGACARLRKRSVCRVRSGRSTRGRSDKREIQVFLQADVILFRLSAREEGGEEGADGATEMKNRRPRSPPAAHSSEIPYQARALATLSLTRSPLSDPARRDHPCFLRERARGRRESRRRRDALSRTRASSQAALSPLDSRDASLNTARASPPGRPASHLGP
jgi:hypothetical protein